MGIGFKDPFSQLLLYFVDALANIFYLSARNILCNSEHDKPLQKIKKIYKKYVHTKMLVEPAKSPKHKHLSSDNKPS